MSKKFEKIREKAEKLRQLELQGVGGESENGKHMLDEFLKKNGITREDVFGSEIIREFRMSSLNESSSFMNDVINSVNPNAEINVKRDEKNKTILILKVALSDSELIEVEYKYKVMWRQYNKEKELFFLAFKNKHAPYFVSDVPLKLKKNHPQTAVIVPDEPPKENCELPPPDEGKHSMSDLKRMTQFMEAMSPMKYSKASRSLENKIKGK